MQIPHKITSEDRTAKIKDRAARFVHISGLPLGQGGLMNLTQFWDNKDEQPLDRIVNDGGMCAIFRKIACIGDSLSSGEFEGKAADGQKSYHDMFEYSWGQYIARAAGNTVYNFSRGGMTAKEYCDAFAKKLGLWDKEKACQAYIIALGVNDITRAMANKEQLGGTDDVNIGEWRKNKPTFVLSRFPIHAEKPNARCMKTATESCCMISQSSLNTHTLSICANTRPYMTTNSRTDFISAVI